MGKIKQARSVLWHTDRIEFYAMGREGRFVLMSTVKFPTIDGRVVVRYDNKLHYKTLEKDWINNGVLPSQP